MENKLTNQVFYGYAKKENVRQQSSSGGIFYELAQQVLQTGGIVYGVIFDAAKKKVRYSHTDEVPLEKLLRSKYVAAEIGDTFSNIISNLKENRSVLFCGTPCTVSGLRNVIENSYKSYKDNLLLVDFLCEGTPSPEVFSAYLKKLEDKYHSRVTDINFRSKTYGWKTHCMKIDFENGKQYIRPYFLDSYMDAFINDLLFNRPSCYDCRFREKKYSDITLGDFWKVNQLNPKLSDNRGVSVIIVHSTKGSEYLRRDSKLYLEEVKGKDIHFTEQKLDTRKHYEPRNQYMKEFIHNGYSSSIKRKASIYNKSFIRRIKDLRYWYILEQRRKNGDKIK